MEVCAGGASGSGADRYAAGNIVLVEVPHDRVCRGETDEVVARIRSEAAERGVVGVFEACGAAPDFFRDVWRAGEGRLCSVACFEDAGRAAEFARTLGGAAAGECGGCRLVDDPAWRAEEARYFSSEWRKARDAERAAALAELAAADADGRLGRAFAGVFAAADAAAAQAVMDGVSGILEGAGVGDGGAVCASTWADGSVTVAVGFMADVPDGLRASLAGFGLRAAEAGGGVPDGLLSALKAVLARMKAARKA